MGTPIIQIMEWNGDSTKTDKTASTVRFKSADSPAVDSSNPLTIPGAGRTYSFEKFLRLRIGSGDPAEQLSNLKFYTDGGNSFGGNVFLFTHQAADFTQTFRSASNLSTNNNPPQGGSGSKTLTTVFSYTAAGGYSLSSAAETFSGSSTDIGNFVVMCMRVDPGATSGTLSAETLSFSYDTSAAATTAGYTQIVSLNAAIAKTFTTAMSLDSIVGKAVDDGTFDCIISVSREIDIDELTANDFTVITNAEEDTAGNISTTAKLITSVTGAVGGSASLADTYISFIATQTGTVSFKYVGSYLGTVATGSVALAAVPFSDTALTLNFTTLSQQNGLTENRSGTTRATGLDDQPSIVSYLSGQQRYDVALDSLLTPLGLLVEDTGANIMTNSNLSGGTTTPTGWESLVDGTRSATASTLGDADAANAFKFIAAPVSGGGPGGRPFLNREILVSSSVTYTQSCIIEFYTGGASSALLGWAGLGSATGTQFVTAGQLSSLPQLIQATWMNISGADDTAGCRFGPGISVSVSGSMIISRPMLTRGKSAAQSYSPDARVPDRPTVALGTDFPYNTAGGSFIVQARTAKYLGNQVLFQIDAGSAGNAHIAYRDISGHLHYTLNQSGTAKADIIYSAIANDTTFRLAIDYSGSSVTTQLDSATTVQTDATVQLPDGLTTLRLGHDISGNQWNSTIAEFNAFRSTRGLVGAAGGSESGGSSTTNPSIIPLNYYGQGHYGIGLSNAASDLRAAGRTVDYRFRALQNGVITKIKWYCISSSTSTGYSRYLGALGKGGLIRLRIWSNNPNAGAAGTAANVPSTVLATWPTWDAHADTQGSQPELTGSCNVCAGVVYHLTFDNIHSDPADNYISVDYWNQGNGTQITPHNPQIPDLYDEVLSRTTSTNTWIRRDGTPIVQFSYNDSASFVQGMSYLESNYSAGDEGAVSVGGANQARQTMVPDETMVLTQFNIHGKFLAGTTAPLVCTIRQQSNGFVLDTISAATSLGSTSSKWISKNLNSNITFSASTTYTFTLTASAGTWQFQSVRDGGAGNIGGAARYDQRISVRGRAEKSTNSGSSFTGLVMNNNTNTVFVDYMFYFLKQ